ncbi:MAG: hypothetical protein DMG12_07975 [Acidobacteria bacterium]|nr:MAG: hypothetical protein DMG12_07975 [Acidobacteriota bacterium]
MLRLMQKLAVLSLILLGAVVGTAQSEKKMPRKVPGASKPECAQGSICFSGEIREGQTFRKDLTAGLEFVLGLPGSFQVEIKHAEASCKQLFWVADPPFHAHRPTEIDATYDWTAEQEVETSPREFRFATSCEAYRTLFDLSQTDAEKYIADFKSLANGEGRLWITDSRVTHSHGINSKEQGAVEWMKFSVEIKLSKPN